MLNSETRRDERGAERCARKIMKAVPNVFGDDSKGYHNTEAICNAPITVRISDNVKGCPNCDKEPAVGNVKPRTISSSSIALTLKEMEECGLKPDGTRIDGKVIATKVAAQVAPEVNIPVEGTKMAEVRKDSIRFEVSLESLEGDIDVAAFLIKRASESLDELPVTNFKESKRLIRLQEKLESLLRV